jgi:protein involved in polysaccharide export with SLBB domain
MMLLLPRRAACTCFLPAVLALLLTGVLSAQQIPVPTVGRTQAESPRGTPPPPLPENLETRAGSAAVSATVSMDVLDVSRPLARGDVVNFRIVEDRDPPISLRINDSGDIEVPYVGRVGAQGKTPRTLAQEIKGLLERDYYHSATVILGLDMEGQRTPGRIYVTGAVSGAGPQEIPFNEKFTVSKAILRAGGFADFANQRKVKLTRAKPDGTTDTMIIDVKEVIEKGRQDLDVEVLPNDFIVVSERLINF